MPCNRLINGAVPLAAAAILSACAWGSDVEQTGNGSTFRVSQTYAPVRGGVPRARTEALNMAQARCQGMGRDFYALEETTIPWPPTYEVVFSCIDAGQGN